MATDVRRGDEAELYRLHHERLVRAVARSVGAPHALIEDACSFAWLQLLRHQPQRRPELFAWLRTVRSVRPGAFPGSSAASFV